MQTKCPHCQTVFKVSDEHLKMAEGYVRCGICKEVFNALEKDQPAEKKEDKPVESISPKKVEATKPTAPPVKPSVQNDQAAAKPKAAAPVQQNIAAKEAKPEAPKPAASKTRAPEPKPVTKAAEPVKPEAVKATPNKPKAVVPKTFAAAPESNIDNSAIDNDFFDGVQSKLIPDEFRIPELHNTYSLWQDLSWSAAILLLTASLFVEYAWFNRNELINNPQLKPLLTQLCIVTNCDEMSLRKPDEIEMTTRNIYTHPNVKNALMVSGALINHAQFEQTYPNILIDFSDVRGKVIASRTFTPEDYLQIKIEHLKPLPPQVPISFNMEIQDPGKDAMTYEFSFL